uniref:ADP,ATP carrier protein n=2 Tax=Panagrellus redivivus TaxID=6233 RepID=A0A7E4VJT7_PANRE
MIDFDHNYTFTSHGTFDNHYNTLDITIIRSILIICLCSEVSKTALIYLPLSEIIKKAGLEVIIACTNTQIGSKMGALKANPAALFVAILMNQYFGHLLNKGAYGSYKEIIYQSTEGKVGRMEALGRWMCQVSGLMLSQKLDVLNGAKVGCTVMSYTLMQLIAIDIILNYLIPKYVNLIGASWLQKLAKSVIATCGAMVKMPSLNPTKWAASTAFCGFNEATVLYTVVPIMDAAIISRLHCYMNKEPKSKYRRPKKQM